MLCFSVVQNKKSSFSFLGQLVFSPVFHYAELHLGLEGTLYILTAVVGSGILFGYLFKPLNNNDDDDKQEHINNNLGQVNLAFTINDIEKVNFKSKVKQDVLDEENEKDEPFYIEYLGLFNNLPMMMLMLSHLLMHLGDTNNKIIVI